jgi:hypothetical protein
MRRHHQLLENSMKKNKTIVIVAGLDSDGRPHAAQFPGSEAVLVTKAASLMGFSIGFARDTKSRAAVQSLPKGKLFASGRARVPYQKLDAYGRLANSIELKPPVALEELEQVHTDRKPDGSLLIGDLVLAFESKELGWWEAIVLSIDETLGQLTLRWRDFPSAKQFARPLSEVAVIGVASVAVSPDP